MLKHGKLFEKKCSGRRVFYSITTGRTTEIAEVLRRQPLDDWKIGPKALTNGKGEAGAADAVRGSDSMLQGFCPESSNGSDVSTDL